MIIYWIQAFHMKAVFIMKYDVIVVGGGIAGLTSAAFLSQSGYQVLLCEKEDRLGGLVGSFPFNGFVFDAGIRAMENSGVLFPMLRQLGIDIEFCENTVSIGIGDKIVHIRSEQSIAAYQDMLTGLYPKESEAIARIVAAAKQSMTYMDVLYGIDNPLFMDLKNDRDYLQNTLMPWLFKYLATLGKIKRLGTPVEDYLKTFTQNQALIDMIAQHFFTQTPASFALSYFSLYLDYNYPKGGTGVLIAALTDYIRQNGGTILTSTPIAAVNPAEKTAFDESGNAYSYRQLIWAADSKALYASLRGTDRLSGKCSRAIRRRAAFIANKKGGDSVLTLYLAADVDPSYFAEKNGPHFFYTPENVGLSTLSVERIMSAPGSFSEDTEAVFDWIQSFLRLTTFEISIPAMRDEALAPKGKTGLIISTLMDYSLVKHIERQGWYDAFKALCRDTIMAVLIDSIYPALDGHIADGFVSTPLTLQRRTGNTDGAITGWSFANDAMPAVNSMIQIAQSIKTPVPHVAQAGQWTYSPSGFPISILTGKLAADYATKKLKR